MPADHRATIRPSCLRPAGSFASFRAALLRVEDAEKERDRIAAEVFAVGATVSYPHGDNLSVEESIRLRMERHAVERAAKGGA